MITYAIIMRPLSHSIWIRKDTIQYELAAALKLVQTLNEMQANGYMYAVLELTE